MSRPAVIVSLLIALGLTAISIFALRPIANRASEREVVLELDPAAVTALSVEHDGTAARVERGRLPGEWIVHTGEAAWPIAPERMRAALRVLTELRGAPVDDAMPEGAGTLTLERESPRGTGGGVPEGADPLALRIAPPGLGGRRLVEVAGQVYQVDDWLHEAFIESGPADWRAKSAMPGVSVDASRVTITSGGRRIAMNRAGGRWALTAPVGARASGPAVEALLGLLAKAGVTRFYDEAPADDVTGLREPLASVRVERDIQIPDGATVRREREVVTLEIGGPTDTTMTTLFARVTIETSLEGAARGQAVVGVSAAELNRINPQPEAYIAPQSAPAPASEIGALALAASDGGAARVTIERTAGGWQVVGGEADGAALSAPDAAAMDEALDTLCAAPAGALVIERPAGYAPALSVELRSLGGSPLAILEIGTMPAPERSGAERFLVVRDGETFRIYESRTIATLELLQGFLDAAGSPEPEPAEIGALAPAPGG